MQHAPQATFAYDRSRASSTLCISDFCAPKGQRIAKKQEHREREYKLKKEAPLAQLNTVNVNVRRFIQEDDTNKERTRETLALSGVGAPIRAAVCVTHGESQFFRAQGTQDTADFPDGLLNAAFIILYGFINDKDIDIILRVLL